MAPLADPPTPKSEEQNDALDAAPALTITANDERSYSDQDLHPAPDHHPEWSVLKDEDAGARDELDLLAY